MAPAPRDADVRHDDRGPPTHTVGETLEARFLRQTATLEPLSTPARLDRPHGRPKHGHA